MTSAQPAAASSTRAKGSQDTSPKHATAKPQPMTATMTATARSHGGRDALVRLRRPQDEPVIGRTVEGQRYPF